MTAPDPAAIAKGLDRPAREYFTCSHCGDGPWHFSWCFESGPFAYGHDGQTLHDYRKVKNGLCPNCSGAD